MTKKIVRFLFCFVLFFWFFYVCLSPTLFHVCSYAFHRRKHCAPRTDLFHVVEVTARHTAQLRVVAALGTVGLSCYAHVNYLSLYLLCSLSVAWCALRGVWIDVFLCGVGCGCGLDARLFELGGDLFALHDLDLSRQVYSCSCML